jgi:SRSO17 transposase
MQMETSHPISPDLLRHSISSAKQAPTSSQSTAAKALATKLSKIKAPTLLRHKTVKDISYKTGSNTNLSQSNQHHSILTDNSERLRENLSQIRKQKEKKTLVIKK